MYRENILKLTEVNPTITRCLFKKTTPRVGAKSSCLFGSYFMWRTSATIGNLGATRIRKSDTRIELNINGT